MRSCNKAHGKQDTSPSKSNFAASGLGGGGGSAMGGGGMASQGKGSPQKADIMKPKTLVCYIWYGLAYISLIWL